MFRDRKRLLLLLPLLALATGAALLAYGRWGHLRDVEATRRLFEAHADSVAALVGEGAREAALSTSLLYEMADAVEGDGEADAGAPDGGAGPLLAELRRETGIGPLLRGVVRQDVLYAALQDAEGVLAVAPSEAWLSPWAADPALAGALGGAGSGGASRLRRAGGADVFERLVRFGMPDDSTVLLRVGIDASALLGAEEESRRRFVVLAILVAGIALLVGLLTALVWRWQARREELQRVLDAQRAERDHWETIGRMAATVAHEVRNPLNAITMISQRLGREFSVGEADRAEFGEMTEMLRAEAARVNRVVTDFLDLGKPLRLSVRETDVREAVEAALAPGRLRAEKEGKILEAGHGFPGAAPLDGERLAQILGNLVDNALDALPGGGRVRVATAREGGSLRITVADDGPGMTAEELREVVKPFVSLKASGTGLGLPLVDRMVRAHGGAFALRSAPGEGTTAEILIPARGGMAVG